MANLRVVQQHVYDRSVLQLREARSSLKDTKLSQLGQKTLILGVGLHAKAHFAIRTGLGDRIVVREGRKERDDWGAFEWVRAAVWHLIWQDQREMGVEIRQCSSDLVGPDSDVESKDAHHEGKSQSAAEV